MTKKTKQKTREQHIKDVLIDLENNLLNFQLSLQVKDKTINEYVRLLNLTKTECRKIFNEDRQLKKFILLEKEKNILNNKKEKIIKKKTI